MRLSEDLPYCYVLQHASRGDAINPAEGNSSVWSLAHHAGKQVTSETVLES